jgi:RNA polymerase sigma-54 factor
MSMKPSLQVRLSQHLALTPQLQQSIRLLQLSTLELHQEVEQMLEQNPFLDVEEDSGSPFETPLDRTLKDDRASERTSATERDDEAAGPADAASGDGEGLSEVSGQEFGTTERDDWENGTERDDFDGIRETPSSGTGAGSDDEDGGEAQDRRATSTSLPDHLRAQIAGMRLEPDDLAALHVLIESLNGDGYLADPLDEIAERLAEMLDLGSDATAREELADRLQCALRWLQALEPAGVGARGLEECLVLQLRLTPPCRERRLAITICEKYLELLARRDMRRLTALTGATEDQIRAAQALIVQCEPKPGRPFSDAESNIIVPDVIVQRAGRGLKVVLNPDVMPKLRINDLYAQAVRGQRGTGGDVGPAAGGALVHEEHPAALRHHPARQQGHRRTPEELLHARRHRHEAAGAARDRRRTGPARKHHLARDHRQVHGHALRHLRAEVLLRQQPEHRSRRQRRPAPRCAPDPAARGR